MSKHFRTISCYKMLIIFLICKTAILKQHILKIHHIKPFGELWPTGQICHTAHFCMIQTKEWMLGL